MNIVHPAIAEILKIRRYSKFNIGFVSAVVDTRAIGCWFGFSKSIRKVVLQYYIAIRIAIQAWKIHKSYSYIIVLEYFPPYMFFSNIILWPLRKKSMFIMHHSQQYAMRSFFNLAALYYFKLFGFCSIQFEIDDSILPKRVRLNRERTLVIPHPIISRNPQLLPGQRKENDAKIKLGIIGIFREGKPIMELVKYAQGLIKEKLHNCELILGAPHAYGSHDFLSSTGLEVVHTDSAEEYYKCLSSVDISIQAFEKDFYYYRASGTIADAVSCGCYVVCPDFPVIRHQVMWPVKVGATYNSFDDLPEAIIQCIKMVREIGQDNHWLYRKERGAQAIAKEIDLFIEKISGPEC